MPLDTQTSVTDFNGDGYLDFLGANDVFFGDGAGGFAERINFGFYNLGSGTADFNGDGVQDIFGKTIVSPLNIYLSDGAGCFADPVVVVSRGLDNTAVVTANFNGDTHTDFIATDRNGGSVRLYTNQAGASTAGSSFCTKTVVTATTPTTPTTTASGGCLFGATIPSGMMALLFAVLFRVIRLNHQRKI